MKSFFKKLGEFFKKHKKLTVFLIVAAAIILIVIYFAAKVKEAQELMNNMLNAGETAQIERRSLVESLSATGNVTSVDSSDITADVTGVNVVSVDVEVGDYVKAGDVICILDSSDLQTQMENAETSLNAQDKKSSSDVAVSGRLLNEQKDTRNIQISRDFEDAQLRYDDYMDAVEKYDDAQMEYNIAVEKYNWRASEYQNFLDDHSDMAEIDMTRDPDYSFYKNNYESAKSERDSKENALEQAEKNRDSALETYNRIIRTYEDDVRNGDSAVMSKNDNLNTARISQSTTGLNEEFQISQFKDQIDACTVTAPFDGVITAVNVEADSKYTGAVIATIEDDSSLEIKAQIDEYDIAKVKVGQRVVIKTNGTGDVEFDGKVTKVAPKSTKVVNSNGTVTNTAITYAVTIAILNPSDDLKMDMTAKLSIVLDEKEDVLTVPYDAVQVDDEGKFFVEMAPEIDSNDPDAKNKQNAAALGLVENEKLYVEKGIESDYYIEIKGDGVKEGINIIVPSSSNGMDEFMQMLMDQGAMGGM